MGNQTEVLSEEYARDPVWGPMSHPARDRIGAEAAPWKDHIYLAFWDPNADAWGYFHWNSSPNHNTTKAQVCLAVGGERFDFRDELGPSTTRFQSPGLDYDLRSTVTMTSERLAGEIVVAPRFRPVDYGRDGILPAIVAGQPPEHWQQGLSFTGELVFDGEPVVLDGLGFRTRTWGYRDDSNQFEEYISVFACCGSFDVTAMKFKQADGSLKAGGRVVDDEGGEIAVGDLHVRRGPAGLPLSVTLDLADGHTLPLVWKKVHAEFWCPIGPPERDGPTFSAYDQWMELDVDGEKAFGLSEQAIVRHVF